MKQTLILYWSGVQSIISNATGSSYRKRRSLAVSFLLSSALLAVFFFGLFESSQIQAVPLTIDSFETAQARLKLTALGDIGQSASAVTSGPGILGGERDLTVELTAGAIESTSLEAGVSDRAFSLGYDPTIEGTARLEWDGPDGNADSLDPTGLGGVDLTVGGTQDAFLLEVSVDDLPTTPVIEIFSDADRSSSLVLPLPGLIFSSAEYLIPFSAFEASSEQEVDFTNVGAVTLVITSTASLDVMISAFDTASLLTATKTDTLLVDNDGNGQADPGDTLQYTVSLANPEDAFEAEATAVVFSDTLDLNTTLVVSSVTTTQGSVTSGNETGDTEVAVDVGTILDGDNITLAFEVTINDSLPAGVTEIGNQGFVASDSLTNLPTDDPDTDAADDATLTPVSAGPIITATKTDTLLVDNNGNGQADPGDLLQYTVVTTNSGSSEATGVLFDDTPDLNTTLVVSSVTTTQGSVTSGNETGDTEVAVDVGTVAGGGGSLTITFEAAINDPLPPDATEIANQGTVSGDNFSDVPTDDPETAAAGDPTLTP